MRSACLLVLAAGTARADDGLGVRETADPHWLELDPQLPPQLEGVGALAPTTERTERVQLGLGRATSLVLDNREWANEDGGPLPYLDVESRGWHTGARFAHDFGIARVEVTGSWNEVDTRFGAGRYRDVGVSIGRTVRLSRWMHAWLALGVGRRMWEGAAPPAGEANATTVMLTIGTTFR